MRAHSYARSARCLRAVCSLYLISCYRATISCPICSSPVFTITVAAVGHLAQYLCSGVLCFSLFSARYLDNASIAVATYYSSMEARLAFVGEFHCKSYRQSLSLSLSLSPSPSPSPLSPSLPISLCPPSLSSLTSQSLSLPTWFPISLQSFSVRKLSLFSHWTALML